MSACMVRLDDETARPSIAIFDSHLLVAQGLARALGNSYEIKTVLRSGRELEKLVHASPPDVIITEIDLLEQNGLEALEHIRSAGINVPCVICTSRADPATVRRAFYAGANGVVTKQEDVAALQSAVGLVLQGKMYISGAFMPAFIDGQALRTIQLSTRQRLVLELIDQGMSAQQIADKLGLSRRTVESHQLKLLRLTNTRSSLELLVRARHLGLLDPVRRLRSPET